MPTRRKNVYIVDTDIILYNLNMPSTPYDNFYIMKINGHRFIYIIILSFLFMGAKNCSEKFDPNPIDIECLVPDNSQYDTAPTCSSDKMAEILESATKEKSSVTIRCSFTLDGSEKISKKLVLSGDNSSGVSIDCNRAMLGDKQNSTTFGNEMIQIKSTYSEKLLTWSVPKNIKIKNCDISGRIRIWGNGRNGEDKGLRKSSYTQDHVAQTRNIAPNNILIENSSINSPNKSIPLYMGPGVNNVTLKDSIISGEILSTAIYLDTESCGNNILNNSIHPSPDKRELIAIDGSSQNTISHNHFSGLNKGGIFLYRNCGEGGTIRHSIPARNTISENTFYYNNYKGKSPAIFLGSREGKRKYCDDDSGYNFGSSLSNFDYAWLNNIVNNSIKNRDPKDVIKESSISSIDNLIKGNYQE